MRSRGWNPQVFGDPGQPMSAPAIQGELAHVAADPSIHVVVIATASNDNLQVAQRAAVVGLTRSLREYRALVSQTMAAMGNRCVVLVDVRDRSNAIYHPHFAPSTNAAMREVASARPDTVVVDWSDISRPHTTDWFAADELHFATISGPQPGSNPHPAGALAYAASIADGVARCLGDRPTPPPSS
jgi:hypothetical protein